jgi:DNA polymerase
VVGEAPGAEEDELGEGFVGQAGSVLDALLVRHGLERNRDYGVANVVRCRPPDNRKPRAAEIERCLPWLARTLVVINPSVLLLVGGTAARVFLGDGSLQFLIERSQSSTLVAPDRSHPELAGALSTMRSLHLVPMPHTSGMAWNRKAPDGRLWRDIGAAQVALAVRILKEIRERYAA